MYVLSLLTSAVITFFIASKLAGFFLAKRPEIKWVILASLGSALIAVTSYIGLTFIIALLDRSATDPSQTLTNLYPMLILSISGVIILLLSSVAFKVVNQMCWSSAIATNTVAVAIMLIAVTGGSKVFNGVNENTKAEVTKTAPSAEIIVKDESIANLLSPN